MSAEAKRPRSARRAKKETPKTTRDPMKATAPAPETASKAPETAAKAPGTPPKAPETTPGAPEAAPKAPPAAAAKAKKAAPKEARAKGPSREAPASPHVCKSTDYAAKKKYLKSKPECQVTFVLPKDAAPKARKVVLVGDFNDWDMKGIPLKASKDSFKVTVKLPSNGAYRYRYLIDGSRWENDWCADRYEPNQFGSDDSVVVT
jgi:hypothetical protein